MKTQMHFSRALALLFVFTPLFFFTSGCVRETNPITGQPRAYAYTWDQEVQIGRQSDPQIVEQFGLYEDPQLQAYVNEIGQAIVQMSHFRDEETPEQYQQTEFTFRVLNSHSVNALALPGGYVYITRGLLTHVNNEAQLAVVLGHEVAHVIARHASRQAYRAQIGQLGLIAGTILGQAVLGDLGGNLLNIGGPALELLIMRYSRESEREADRLGLEYAASRGYEVAESAAFFQTLDRIRTREGSVLPNWQSTHPDPGERMETVTALSRAYDRPGAIKVVGQDALYQRIEGMIMGENPREGFVQNNVFYHPDLRFQFPVPAGWRVNNERAAVLMLEPNRQALMALEIAPAATAREAAARLAQTQGITVTQSREASINGLPAMAVVAQANTRQGRAGILNYFIEYDGRVYSILGYTAAQRFQAMAPQFEQTMTRFAPVTDPQILNVQPARLQIVRATSTAPFRSFAPTTPVAGLRPDDFAILNQVEMDTIIPAGTPLKLPRVGAQPERQILSQPIRIR
jgi:predicted Zn-dependent protease